MKKGSISFSVFTKPWKSLSVWEMGKQISGWGFDGIEFPLREGYLLEPKDAEKGLLKLVQQLSEHGLKIFSVASVTDEHVFAGCAEAGIPIIRIMPDITKGEGYLASEQRVRRQLESLVPLCEKYGVKVGLQQHYGDNVVDSTGMLHLIEGFEPKHIGAIWDAAHDALAGQQPEYGLDIVWSHLCMVNFKNAYYKRSNGPEAQQAEWKRYFTLGSQGLASWRRAVEYLKYRNYHGVVCLTAEYTNEDDVNRLIQLDINYAKQLFIGEEA
ncbi:sugar phosphate isomerase/epimerase family protein [Cohnella zeiphila]|uniref:Sugar phosphate isomerase/epimerase n=1 Tax=Cohnella zeiphila TaxID=2761120 RepID=A0A7X0SMT8_9BACL|nr:sugar phosphate isomerase/epimerase family protein [Cohnella zeiphila]MBB6732746.1 sugar phosphate isomerase/epimerase [Cohnella zeiphila]